MSEEKKTPLIELMRRRYPLPEYALMREVSDAAGHSRSRSADYIAVNLYPSRGLSITGFEVKSSRGDWLSEMKNPQKAENIFKYCDYFNLLTTSDKVILNPNEIPETWGWINLKGERFYTMKEAPKLTPVGISKHFMAAMLKRSSSVAGDYIHKDLIEDRINDAVNSATNYSRKYQQDTADELKKLHQQINTFEVSSGLDFHGFNWDKEHHANLGKAVKFVLSGGIEAENKQLLRLQEQAQSIANHISTLLKTPV